MEPRTESLRFMRIEHEIAISDCSKQKLNVLHSLEALNGYSNIIDRNE